MQEYIRDLYVDYGYERSYYSADFSISDYSRPAATCRTIARNMYLPVTADTIDASKTGATSENKEDNEGPQDLESLAQKPMKLPEPLPDLRPNEGAAIVELPWRVADFGRLHRYERGRHVARSGSGS